MVDETTDDSRDRIREFYADHHRPENPPTGDRRLVVVLAVAVVAGIVAGVVTLLRPLPPPNPSRLAQVTASRPLPGSQECSVSLLMPTGELSTIEPSACMPVGALVITSVTGEGLLEAKRLQRAGRVIGAFFSAAIWFGITLAATGVGMVGYAAWRRRRTARA